MHLEQEQPWFSHPSSNLGAPHVDNANQTWAQPQTEMVMIFVLVIFIKNHYKMTANKEY